MKSSDQPRRREEAVCPDDGAGGLPRDIELLLTEIEKEPIPEKLMALAVELQQALVRRRQPSER